MKYIFDLDGTIAPYGKQVRKKVADAINQLKDVMILSGGPQSHLEWACEKLRRDIVKVGMRSMVGNSSIDCSMLWNVSKPMFGQSKLYQRKRRMLCNELRRAFDTKQIYVGGRATIDIMLKSTKENLLPSSEFIYFYDCEWDMNLDICNDAPVIKHATKAIRTNDDLVIQDIERCLRK